jgi:hypothetical protein
MVCEALGLAMVIVAEFNGNPSGLVKMILVEAPTAGLVKFRVVPLKETSSTFCCGALGISVTVPVPFITHILAPSNVIADGIHPTPEYVVIWPVGLILVTVLLGSAAFVVHILVPSKAMLYGYVPVPVYIVIPPVGVTFVTLLL